jgi:hypothetical protein
MVAQFKVLEAAAPPDKSGDDGGSGSDTGQSDDGGNDDAADDDDADDARRSDQGVTSDGRVPDGSGHARRGRKIGPKDGTDERKGSKGSDDEAGQDRDREGQAKDRRGLTGTPALLEAPTGWWPWSQRSSRWSSGSSGSAAGLRRHERLLLSPFERAALAKAEADASLAKAQAEAIEVGISLEPSRTVEVSLVKRTIAVKGACPN